MKTDRYCDPEICPDCQYIGEGASFCDEIHKIVLDDWGPTENFMGPGCPYIESEEDQNKNGGKEI